jgi:hypothetical protein
VTSRTSDPRAAVAAPPAPRLPGWWRPAAVAVVAAAGLALFFVSLRTVDLARMNGLGLLSVLPPGAIAGVTLLALAFMAALALPDVRPPLLAGMLAGLVLCLDGVTAFIEAEPRFPTTYQIAGYVNYISSTGHTAPGLDAYFSWPGFFALVSFVAGAAGAHDLLPLLRVWPTVIDLLYLPPLFLFMRGLRIGWRARWLAGFLFVVGNWVGQDYFSPQAFNFLLYLVFVAICVNWFAQPGRTGPPPAARSALARLHRRIFGVLRPGELPPRPIGTGQKAFLLAVLIAVFTVSATSHQLTPFFVIGACAALVVVRRCTLKGLPVLLGVILAGWISFATVDFWSGHLSTIFGGIGALGANLSTSVGGRLTGSSPTHLLALHARILVPGVIVVLAGAGLLRRRFWGLDDRVLIALLCVPVLAVGLQSYGGEIALRTYLFMLPAACPLAACLVFPDPQHGRPRWRPLLALGACAVALPVAFLLARYGNEAFEQTPAGELAATNWIYAHDGGGARVLWLSQEPSTDVTPLMPWAYQDVSKVVYVPVLAPRDPASVAGLASALRRAGPGSYLVEMQTQVAALQQTASYPPNWARVFNASMSAVPGVRAAYTTGSAVVYTMRWPPGTPRQPLELSAGRAIRQPAALHLGGLALLWLLLALLAVAEFARACCLSPRLIRFCTLGSLPLLAGFVGVIILRFASLS